MKHSEQQREFSLFRGARDLRAVGRHVRQRGPIGAAGELVRRLPRRLRWAGFYAYHRRHDRAFDQRHGIDTCGVVDQAELTAVGQNQAHGLEYEPTPVRSFQRMLADLDIDLGSHTFVDFGSGKGRTLLLAAEAGFGRVIGVEFARELHEAAVANIATAASGGGDATSDVIELVNEDAAAFDIPDESIVFYLYYPFRGNVMEQVLANIYESYTANPRKMFFINRLDKPEWLDDAVSHFSALDFVRRRPAPSGWRSRIDAPADVAVYETIDRPDDGATPAEAPREGAAEATTTSARLRRLLAGGPVVATRRVTRVLVRRLHLHADRDLDQRWGVTTTSAVHSRDLTMRSEGDDIGDDEPMYLPTSSIAFRTAMARLPRDLSDYVFVDYGSGMGRTLLLATEYGFKRHLGVEFAVELHEIAERNFAEAVDDRHHEVRSILVDATTWTPPDEPCVFYFFHPFEETVTEKVVARIRQSYLDHPRAMLLVYYKPVHRAIMDRQDFLVRRPLGSFAPRWWMPNPYELEIYQTSEVTDVR